MKRQSFSLFASAVMLCAAAVLFAHDSSTPATARTGVTNAAITPIPGALDQAIIKVLPASNPTAVGEEITIAKLSEIISTKSPGLLSALASKFKAQGWEWTPQTKVKVTTSWYRVLPGQAARIAPPDWDWKQVMAVSTSFCGNCSESELLGDPGSCCQCCIIE
jgi:hypothetical protein